MTVVVKIKNTEQPGGDKALVQVCERGQKHVVDHELKPGDEVDVSLYDMRYISIVHVNK